MAGLLFPLGVVVMELDELLVRHVSGNWGKLGDEDRALNEQAVREDLRIFSAYDLPGGERLWIITEAERSATTILLSSEY